MSCVSAGDELVGYVLFPELRANNFLLRVL